MPATSVAQLLRAFAGIAIIAATASCGGGDSLGSGASRADSVATAGGRVDSALTIEEHLRRFREAVGPDPDTLRHAASSLDALARTWARAVAARDTATLVALTLDRAEFAWLFYSDTPMAKPPYEMPPGLLWSQITGNGSEGLRKALDRLGGHRLSAVRIACETPPERQGPNVIRQGCTVTLQSDGGAPMTERYFGSIVERDGRFKLLSHANNL